MSCQSCSGCFTGDSCSTKESSSKNKTRFQDLLNAAALQSNEETEEHEHIIPTIAVELSKNVYASQTVLIKAYDTLDRHEFLSLSKYLYQTKLVGEHIAWADEYCKGDIKELLRIISSEEEKYKLLQHCDDRAEIHEMFGNLPPGTIKRVNQGKTET